MKSRFTLALRTVILLTVPGSMAAQEVSAEITVKVPINLTQLSSTISKVLVRCTITSSVITNPSSGSMEQSRELDVLGGQVVTTATLVFSFTRLNNPVGKQGNISCEVTGFYTLGNMYVALSPTATNPYFKVSAPMTSNTPFVW